MLLAAPLPAFAVPTCPANGLCVDESVEGQKPTLTAPAGVSTSITPQAEPVGEGWVITFNDLGAIVAVTQHTFSLQEPGSQLMSDAIPDISISSPPGLLQFTLLSDNDLGQIATTCCTSFAIEDGTFQFTGNSYTNIAGTTFDLYLKSDIDVPEPASLALLGTALVGFGVIRRRRGLRRRNYEFTA